MDAVAAIARAVLYEGYILWPYRRSALKNQQRWTFGGVFPESWSSTSGTNDVSERSATVLVEGAGDAAIDVRIRFLHIVERRVAKSTATGLEDTDELTVAGERYLSWEEATEREAILPSYTLTELEMPRTVAIDIAAGSETELLMESDDRVAGAVQRSWRAIAGALEVFAVCIRPNLYHLTGRVTNTTPNATPLECGTRAEAQTHTMISMHMVLRTNGGAFVSTQEPPEPLRSIVESSKADGLWPVLVGEAGVRDTMLASPIILSDYPQIAPESPGDLFDGGEIDQLLILNVLALTDEEQREMRDSDPHAREILDRCRSMSPEQLMSLHGMVRGVGEIHEGRGVNTLSDLQSDLRDPRWHADSPPSGGQ
ncbi:MAG: hypothetical protein ACR2MQ_09315 [Gemmatimonadaceae bacterium]